MGHSKEKVSNTHVGGIVGRTVTTSAVTVPLKSRETGVLASDSTRTLSLIIFACDWQEAHRGRGEECHFVCTQKRFQGSQRQSQKFARPSTRRCHPKADEVDEWYISELGDSAACSFVSTSSSFSMLSTVTNLRSTNSSPGNRSAKIALRFSTSAP